MGAAGSGIGGSGIGGRVAGLTHRAGWPGSHSSHVGKISRTRSMVGISPGKLAGFARILFHGSIRAGIAPSPDSDSCLQYFRNVE